MFEPEDSQEDLGEEGLEDMVNMLKLTEENMLRNVQLRFSKQMIYTYTGSILVSVNPYKMFNIYGLDTVQKYEGQMLGSQPPHLFAIGNSAFMKMTNDFENQVIVISGESGAGKTESTKLLMHYLATACNKNGTNPITERILEANPLLEAFGNAKTIRNDNSSRFGKYVELYFRSGTIVGAKTTEYLLEKCRIVTQIQEFVEWEHETCLNYSKTQLGDLRSLLSSQAPEERNYHIFYELLLGLPEDQKKELFLTSVTDFSYLSYGKCCTVGTRNDGGDFKEVQSALELLEFSADEQLSIYKMMAAILHIGNISFAKVQNTYQNESCSIENESLPGIICTLLELLEGGLIESLTMKVTEARNERLLTSYTRDQAMDARDAIAKALYHRLFTWLVQKINETVKCENLRRDLTSIAILDIFGFEDLTENSFEQLCINYANESLQFYFNKHIFKIEQEEYEREEVTWFMIDYQDNQPVADLIGRRPHGILCLLDEESNFPSGNDKSFLEKCHHHHTSDPCYIKPRMSGPEFCIKHYAGDVTYNVKQFLDKNRDTLRGDVVQLLIQSKNALISRLFKELYDKEVSKSLHRTTAASAKLRTSSVANSFNESLQSLLDTMSKCNPWFVRCIKPNKLKTAILFEPDTVLRQLRYTGMLETIKIRKLGYPVRHKFDWFCNRYFVLLRGEDCKLPRTTDSEQRTACEAILNSLEPCWIQSWLVGTSKIFLKEPLSQHLDVELKSLVNDAVITLQKFLRGFISRRKYSKALKSIVKVQACLKCWKARKQYKQLKLGIISAQAQVRMRAAKKAYEQIKSEHRKKLEQEEKHKNDLKRQQAEAEQRLLAKKEKRKTDEKRERQNELKKKEEKEILIPPNHRVMVNNLEITPDLAYLFNKTNDMDQVNSDKNLTVVNDVLPRNLNLSLPTDIDSFILLKYANVYCKDTLSLLSPSPLKGPILAKSNDKDLKDSIAISQLLLRHLNNQNETPLRERVITNYIIQKGLMNAALRDEIFLQIVNKTFDEKEVIVLHRAWSLMANCLSCFQPSSVLASYLLKYVSDHGYKGYRAFCQQKLLESCGVDSSVSRVHSTCLLEFASINRKLLMALQSLFYDGFKTYGQIDSWTTAEEFASHLLQQRNLTDGHYGWTMLLKHGNLLCECAGYDFVLDIIKEIETPAEFLCRSGYFLISSDKTSRKPAKTYIDDKQGVMALDVEELEEFVPVPPRPAVSLNSFFRHDDRGNREQIYAKVNDALSPSSNLNRRSDTSMLYNGLSHTSAMNVRYVRLGRDVPNSAAQMPSPSSSDMHLQNGDVHRNNGPTNNLRNGIPLASIPENRNEPPNRMGNNLQAANGREKERQRPIADLPDGDIADMDRWLESVFDQALDGVGNEYGDVQSLGRRIMGGGEDEASLQEETVSFNFGPPSSNLTPHVPLPANPPSGLPTTFTGPSSGSIPLGSLQVVPKVAVGTDQLFQQQLMQQQLQQQQWQLQRQNMALQVQLETQQLQNQLLQQSLQGELLRQQLRMVQETTAQPSPLAPKLVPPSSHSHGVIVEVNPPPNNLVPATVVPLRPQSVLKPAVALRPADRTSVISENRLSHVNKTENVKGPHAVSFSTSSNSINVESVPIPNAPPPPPLPPSIRNLPPGINPATIRDRNGVERRVRVGKILWPPPSDDVKKEEVEVGRLEIEEKGDTGELPKLSTEEIRKKISDRILAAQSTVEPIVGNKSAPRPPPKKPAAPPPGAAKKANDLSSVPAVSDDMKKRQSLLQQQLDVAQQPQVQPPPPMPPQPPNPPPMPPSQGNSVAVVVEESTQTTLPKPGHISSLDKTDSIIQSTSNLNIPRVSTGQAKILNTDSGSKTQQTFDLSSLKPNQTILFAQNGGPYLTYSGVPWNLIVRKEVFTPTETINSSLVCDLIFHQILADMTVEGSLRISKKDQAQMKALLDSKGFGHHTKQEIDAKTKRQIIEIARGWPNYFSRIFAVSGGRRLPTVHMVGISHSGIRLLGRHKDANEDYLSIREFIKFEEIVDVSVPKKKTLQIHYSEKYVFLYTHRANQIMSLIEAFCIECEQNAVYVKAIKTYHTRESTLLSFQKGEIIRLTNRNQPLEKGWLYGSIHGKAGMFPAEYVVPMAMHEVPLAELGQNSSRNSLNSISDAGTIQKSFNDASSKYCMLEYAMRNFRESPYRYDMQRSSDTGSIIGSRMTESKKNKHGRQNDWTWKEQVEMIKWTQSPIQASLLNYESNTVNKLALECFIQIMQYMCDYPLQKGNSPFECAGHIMAVCRKHPELRDEVYCQLMKQTTNNRSTKQESCQQGWRLMSLITSYFPCSDVLQPYLIKYIEQTAFDNRRAHYMLAEACLQNFRQTLKYGGRKMVPSKSELSAVTIGRNNRQLLCTMPGGYPVRITIRTSTVVKDAIDQICETLGIMDPAERDEYAFYVIISKDQQFFPLEENIYVMDIITDLAMKNKSFELLFQRFTWISPIHSNGNQLYINLLYEQSRPDYIDGFLLPISSKSLPNHVKDDIAYMAALQIQAANMKTAPDKSDFEICIPVNALKLTDCSLAEWTNRILAFLKTLSQTPPYECQIKFLEILSKWPKFGSTFFSVQSVTHPKVHGSCILAVNKKGVHFCSQKTNEILVFLSFQELLSARLHKEQSGAKFIDLKFGNLMQHSVLELQTEHADAIGTLIDRYIKVEQTLRNKRPLKDETPRNNYSTML